MVRLKGLGAIVLCALLEVFQFQNGAVKRKKPTTKRAMLQEFQFQNGAVKSLLFDISVGVSICISIPKWCG